MLRFICIFEIEDNLLCYFRFVLWVQETSTSFWGGSTMIVTGSDEESRPLTPYQRVLGDTHPTRPAGRRGRLP